MSLMGRLFGTDSAIKSVVETAGSLIDKAFTSDEERRAEAQSKLMDQVIAYANATSGQNVARRLIALLVIGVWLSCYVVAGLMLVAAAWVGEATAGRLAQNAETLGGMATDMNLYVAGITGYYFGHGMVRNWMDGKKK